uniref:Peptidase S49 domain-containing protein n=2 Tax=Clytia hemisphaerica TaxID=252671 RepID=A0A7M5X0L6_9CNID
MDPFQPEKEDDVLKIKYLLNAIHQNFIDHVKKSRGGRLNANDDLLFNGDIWLAQDAIKHGLIDGIDDVSNFVEQRYGKVGEDVKLIRVNSPSANRFGLGGMFGGLTTPLDIQKDLFSKRFDVM